MDYGRHPKFARTYKSWEAMWDRVTNPSNVAYGRYKHLSIQSDWDQFENFLEDMGFRPEGKTLDREKNEQGYGKTNCRWATPQEQQANRRPLQANNKLGVAGVRCKNGRYYEAYYPDGRRSVQLLNSLDFFECVCARKSWEVSNNWRNAND